MNQAIYKQLQEIQEATQEATNEAELSERTQKYLELQRQILFEAFQDIEEITPHPTIVKLPFNKRKIALLDFKEWEDFYEYTQDALNNLLQAYKEIDYLQSRLEKLDTHTSFDDYMKQQLKAWDMEQFEKVLEHTAHTEWEDIGR